MTAQWDKLRTIVEVQFGGPGNAWQVLGVVSNNDTTVTGGSGGGQAFDTSYARDLLAGAGQFQSVATYPTGNPDPYTFTIQKRLRAPFDEAGVNALRRKFGCTHDVRIRHTCGDIVVKTSYEAVKQAHKVNGTSYGEDSNIAEGMVQDGTPVMETIDERAVDEVRWVKVNHLDIKGTVIDFPINDVISVGVFQCAGVCGPGNDGNQDFWFVSDADNSPGYLSNPAPMFGYTRDGGGSWTTVYIGTLTNADATGVAKSGEYVVAVSPTSVGGGVAYVRFADLVDDATTPWAKSTGITNTNNPRAVAALGGLIWAAGVGGYIYRSTDGPFAFTLKSAGTVTTENINSVAIGDENLAYFGADAGALVKYENGVFALLTLTNSAGATVTTANINVVAVPQGADRGGEVYIGTADGRIFRSKQRGAAKTWEELSFDKSGNGSVDDIQFVKPDGVAMYVVQSDVGGARSRVLRDLSGGAMGQDAEPIGSFSNPGNNGINAIAASSPNIAVTVGELVSSQGFIGKIS